MDLEDAREALLEICRAADKVKETTGDFFAGWAITRCLQALDCTLEEVRESSE